ncbi:MAG: hypothetical protein OXC60_09835 [Litoreibacter sp.]|nr:hypothetical protein [Litoreibacter sp.]MCY4334958.1 hypothetical protein [Litoreibacter sp.]
MIIGILRLMAMAFVLMLIVYFVLSYWSRSVRKSKLEEEWELGTQAMDRDTFIKTGLEEYDGSLRRKLIFGVFIVPYLVIGLLVYIVNFQ